MIELTMLAVAVAAWYYHPWFTIDQKTGELIYPTRTWLW